MSKNTENEVKMQENTGNGPDGTGLGEKMAKFDRLAEWFYSEDFRLEEAMGRYKEAMELVREIEKDLANLTNEIEVLAEDFSK